MCIVWLVTPVKQDGWLLTGLTIAAGSSRSHCVVYLMAEKAFPDGRLEYGKLSLVCVQLVC